MKERLFTVQCQVEHKSGDGTGQVWHGSRGVRTFYVIAMSEDDARRQAEGICNPLPSPNVVAVHVGMSETGSEVLERLLTAVRS